MPYRLRVVGILAIVVALVAYAYGPLLGSGFLGDDLTVLTSLEANAAEGARGWYLVEGTGGRPGASLSLHASRALWAAGGVWTGDEALALRFENLVLLFLAAWGLVGFLRRSLEPWAGSDVSRAAGNAGGAFVLLHPVAVASVARLSERGDLLVLALGSWCGWAFLAGRQDRRKELVALAWFLAVLAGLCSPLAFFLPFLMAAGEYQSARRLRPRLARLRTTATTLGVFLFAVGLEAAPRALLSHGARDLIALPSLAAPHLWLERLGVLLMPGNVHGLGASAPLLAALATLIALHPALVAARSAPRLWGRVMLGWSIAMLVAVVPVAGERVTLDGLAGAHVLFPAGVIMAIGLGTSSAALSGWRRTCVPILVGGLFSILGRAQSVPHVRAAEAVANLREDLLAGARQRRWADNLILLDLPAHTAGLDAIGPRPQVLLTPILPPRRRLGDVQVSVVDWRSFEVWSRRPEFSAVRNTGTAVVIEARVLEPEAQRRRTLPLLTVGEELERATWVGEGRSTAGAVFDPVRARFLTVTALSDTDTSQPPVMRWKADLPDTGAQRRGVWIAGEGAPVALFDLERCPTWLLGGRVRSVWTTGALTSITAAELTT
ncbi:MAG: hypothetical protein O2816_05280, partial [Planctomycetota bacterium]|nr:hypothetical protein [Planctomycetota bacterium]